MRKIGSMDTLPRKSYRRREIKTTLTIVREENLVFTKSEEKRYKEIMIKRGIYKWGFSS